ncbi:MAG: Ldh family oxidoreductase [Candidatus Limnocylindria bacterium]
MVTAAGEVVTAERVRTFATSVLTRSGMSAEDAAVTADALAWADTRDIGAQGIAKLPLIVKRLRAGGTSGSARVELVGDTPALKIFDAHGAWGHVAGVTAMRAAIGAADGSGVGAAVVRNTDSASALGYYAMLAVGANKIGVAINNGTPLMAPTGGTTRTVGNQAFAIGAPAGRHPPLLFDTATSAITWTAIEALRERGLPLPADVALDVSGRPTRDHDAALAGILLPMGGHRGFGIALMWEVLTGILSGGPRFARDITPLASLDQPQSVSHFYLTIDPTVVMTYESFTARVDTLIDQIHTSPQAAGVQRVRVPGEQSAADQARRERDGFTLPPVHLREIEELAREVGIAW